jgi:hypothetical protein
MFQRCRFSLVCSAIVAAIVAAAVAGWALADECGTDTPDYTAMRTVTVNGHTVVSQVFVSHGMMREEQDLGPAKMVVLRLPQQHLGYVFDPASKHGVRLPVPPDGQHRTRIVEDKMPDGSRLTHLQFLSGGNWADISITKCSRTGVMLDQSFTSFDRDGSPIRGKLLQTNIKIGPLPEGLFRLPADINIE